MTRNCSPDLRNLYLMICTKDCARLFTVFLYSLRPDYVMCQNVRVACDIIVALITSKSENLGLPSLSQSALQLTQPRF